MNHDQPIIIIKKKASSHGHHGGAWKVAFADFMTAMMAFFLVMWILGLNQESRKAIAAYFNDPTGMLKSERGGNNILKINQDSSKRIKVSQGQKALLKHKKDREGLEKAKAQLEKMVREDPKLAPFRNNIEITLTRDGLRIELLDDKEPLFFESGSSALRGNTVALLRLIGPVLGRLDNDVIIEGHTDAKAFAGGSAGYTNSDLSTDRAQEARRILEPRLRPGQVDRVVGYAAKRLRNPDDPFHYSNRRISILVPSIEYIEGAPVQEADETGLIAPGKPDFQAEYQAQLREAAKASNQ